METQATSIQLARQGAQLEEISKNVARLVDLSENLARMQERETERDDKLAWLFRKSDERDKQIRRIEDRVTSATSWAKGVLSVVVAILLPVAGAVGWDLLHELPAIDRRMQVIETVQAMKIMGTK